MKYVGTENAEHLRNALLRSYALTTDWGDTVYSGMTLKCYNQEQNCDMSMPDYVANVISNLQHDNPKHPQHTPYRYVTPLYSATTQYATRDETPPLSSQQCINIKKITVSVLFKFNVIYFNCAFTKLIVPKEGNRALATMPARESWVGARLSNSCYPSVGLVDLTVTSVSVVFCILQV
jgi:hypothetical protein